MDLLLLFTGVFIFQKMLFEKFYMFNKNKLLSYHHHDIFLQSALDLLVPLTYFSKYLVPLKKIGAAFASANTQKLVEIHKR